MIHTTCAFCHTPVTRRPSDLQYRSRTGEIRPRKHVFCSHQCYGLFNQNKMTLVCATCGDTFQRVPVMVSRNKSGRHYCSVACYNKQFDYAALPPWIPTPTTAAYTAGIVDGEGYIGLTKNGTKVPSLAVAIANTNLLLINFLAENFIGRHNLTTHKVAAHQKPVMLFHIRGRAAIQFLEPILPYLLLKREQAQLGIAFQKLPHHERVWHKQGQQVWETLKTLNQRGKRVT